MDPKQLGISIGRSAAENRTGKTQYIINQVNLLKLSQLDTVSAIDAAFTKGLWLKTFIQNQSNGDIIVSSILAGTYKPVIIVNTLGQSVSGRADILYSNGEINLINIIPDSYT